MCIFSVQLCHGHVRHRDDGICQRYSYLETYPAAKARKYLLTGLIISLLVLEYSVINICILQIF